MTNIDVQFQASRLDPVTQKQPTRLSIMREPISISTLIGGLSGAIIASLAATGYTAIPGFGPVIASGGPVATLVGLAAGTVFGFLGGLLIGALLLFVPDTGV